MIHLKMNAPDKPANEVIDPSDLLTPDELSRRLKVPLGWIYEKCRSGGAHNGNALPVIPCGRFLRFSWVDVCAWLRTNPRLERKPRRKAKAKQIGDK